MASRIKPDDLVIHFLNVGFGDSIVLEFPADNSGNREYGIVDCFKGNKTMDYLGKLLNRPVGSTAKPKLKFICATHPHYDHIKGINEVMNNTTCEEFWDSGFRHNSVTYGKILNTIHTNNMKMLRVSSGMEWYFGRVRVMALSPSVSLRNRYATYGVDMNNASIVLRIEHNKENSILMQSREYTGDVSIEAERVAGRSVVILAGDAEFDSWSHICQEYPKVERASAHKPLVTKMINYLSGSLVKVAHHGSMHSTPLDVYEKMSPSKAIISTRQQQKTKQLNRTTITELSRDLFPHESTVISLEENDIRVLTTDGAYESQLLENGNQKDPANHHQGSIVAVIPPGGNIRWKKLKDTSNQMAVPPLVV